MAKRKTYVISESLQEALKNVPPARKILSTEAKAFFRGLKKRGYSEDQIIDFIKSEGYEAPEKEKFFAVGRPKKITTETNVNFR